jgi:hypothetical protein
MFHILSICLCYTIKTKQRLASVFYSAKINKFFFQQALDGIIEKAEACAMRQIRPIVRKTVADAIQQVSGTPC